MAPFHGKFGKVMWDSSTGNEVELTLCNSWNCTVSSEVAEVTAMEDTWKTYKPGFLDWNATVTCVTDTGTKVPIIADTAEYMGENTPAKLELWLDETGGVVKVLYGSAMCTGINPTVSIDGVGMITYTFEGQAVLAYGTADPTH